MAQPQPQKTLSRVPTKIKFNQIILPSSQFVYLFEGPSDKNAKPGHFSPELRKRLGGNGKGRNESFASGGRSGEEEEEEEEDDEEEEQNGMGMYAEAGLYNEVEAGLIRTNESAAVTRVRDELRRLSSTVDGFDRIEAGESYASRRGLEI